MYKRQRVLRIVDSHILNFDAGARRGHDLVREESALVIGQTRINHGSCCARLPFREETEILADLCFGCTCPVRDRQGDGSDNHEDDEGYNADRDALDTLSLIHI